MRSIISEHVAAAGRMIRVVQGDITLEPVEAVVNAANGRLAHGGGVAGAIVRRGGQSIQEESDDWVRRHGSVQTGGAAITGAGGLRASYVIHAVGPEWGTSDEEAKLALAVHSTLELAANYDVKTISFPAISAGIFGFPHELCAEVIVEAVKGYLEQAPCTSVEEINLVLFDKAMAELFSATATRLLAS